MALITGVSASRRVEGSLSRRGALPGIMALAAWSLCLPQTPLGSIARLSSDPTLAGRMRAS